MISNYNELLICIKKIEKQIFKLKLEQRILINNRNFTKTRQVFAQQQYLELQILNYITHYQEKIKNNYLESKVYSHSLCNLIESYQPKTNINEFIYCLKQLTTEYNHLLKDLKIFHKLNRLEDVNAVKEKIKNQTFHIEEIFLELSYIVLLPNLNIDNNQIRDFNSFAIFFQECYTSKIGTLKKELHSKQTELKSIKTILNFKSFRAIRKEIKTIKAELESIQIRKNDLKFIDQIKWEYSIT
ncbi:hypothetical protein ACFFLS_03030 [Flavobacterium procerum]|uniref:CHAD domain-containing protein n=1 Tax=Flavobacterium procerum TaxID=1455569 RepID=A0ABV6BKN8_9FLAO